MISDGFQFNDTCTRYFMEKKNGGAAGATL